MRMKDDGTQCKNAAILGGAVCRYHGGSAEHVKRRARERLDMAADRAVQKVLEVMETADAKTQLAAANSLLNRVREMQPGVSVEGELRFAGFVEGTVVEIDRDDLGDVVEGEVVEGDEGETLGEVEEERDYGVRPGHYTPALPPARSVQPSTSDVQPAQPATFGPMDEPAPGGWPGSGQHEAILDMTPEPGNGDRGLWGRGGPADREAAEVGDADLTG